MFHCEPWFRSLLDIRHDIFKTRAFEFAFLSWVRQSCIPLRLILGCTSCQGWKVLEILAALWIHVLDILRAITGSYDNSIYLQSIVVVFFLASTFLMRKYCYKIDSDIFLNIPEQIVRSRLNKTLTTCLSHICSFSQKLEKEFQWNCTYYRDKVWKSPSLLFQNICNWWFLSLFTFIIYSFDNSTYLWTVKWNL